jgi:hypothetical protein
VMTFDGDACSISVCRKQGMNFNRYLNRFLSSTYPNANFISLVYKFMCPAESHANMSPFNVGCALTPWG